MAAAFAAAAVAAAGDCPASAGFLAGGGPEFTAVAGRFRFFVGTIVVVVAGFGMI